MPHTIITLAVAEDHTLVRSGLISLLNCLSSFNVIADAANGAELINKIRLLDRKPDIAILDINMPEMNGYDTLVALRRSYPSMKFLVLTMFEKEYSIIRMIKAGANGYLPKGCTAEELHTALKEIYKYDYYYSSSITEKTFELVNKNKLPRLTDRELLYLSLNCSDLTYLDIADQMCLSIRTVQDYQQNLCEKLNLNTRMDLALFALHAGLIPLGTSKPKLINTR